MRRVKVQFVRIQSHLANGEVLVPDDVEIKEWLNLHVCSDDTDWQFNHEEQYVEEYEVIE